MYTSVCVQCRHVVPSQSLLFALNRSQSESKPYCRLMLKIQQDFEPERERAMATGADEEEEEGRGEMRRCIENICRKHELKKEEEGGEGEGKKGEEKICETEMQKLLDDVAIGITCTLDHQHDRELVSYVTRARLKTYLDGEQDTEEKRKKQIQLMEKITREELAEIVRAAARPSQSATSIEEEEGEDEGYDELRARIAHVSGGNDMVEKVLFAVCDARKQKWREMFVEARVALPRLVSEVEWMAAAQTGEQSVSGGHEGTSGGAVAAAGQVEIVLTVEGEPEDVASLPAEKRKVRFSAGRRELTAAISTMRVVKDNLAALVAPK